MKQSQVTVAVILLAVLVFGATFAMNYLGGTVGPQPNLPGDEAKGGRELTFYQQRFPPDNSRLVGEEHSRGQIDFWFTSEHDAPLTVGLDRKGCKCTSVELYTIPDNRVGSLRLLAATLPCLGATGSVVPLGYLATGLAELQKGLEGKELYDRDPDARAIVPAGGVGWVRLRWTAERMGAQGLGASLWTDRKETSRPTPLEVGLFFFEALRVDPQLDMGSLRDSDLEKGVTRDIYCFSSTRPDFRLEARPAFVREGNLFQVGKPERLTRQEMRALYAKNMLPENTERMLQGPILCGYRIPISLRSKSPDGKTSFDIGPFRNRVILESPDIEGQSKFVSVSGRVRGLVEIGNGDDATEVEFRQFQRRHGKKTRIVLFSDVPELKLEFDRERTPRFLSATIAPDKKNPNNSRQSWVVHAEVLPGQASGPFPRREDPLYEDAAIYLKAIVPGKPEPIARPVRIAVSGTASEN